MEQADEDLDALADRAAGGEHSALQPLLARLHPLIVRYCRARLSAGHRSLATADDIAQEVCMAVITALPTYRREGKPFLAFVYGIASHKVIDAHRVGGRSFSDPVAEVPESAALDDNPEGLAVRHSVFGTISRLLEVLPEQQREILRLRIIVGLSAEETAEALGTTPGAVRVSQHRALAKLRKVIAADASLSEQLT